MNWEWEVTFSIPNLLLFIPLLFHTVKNIEQTINS